MALVNTPLVSIILPVHNGALTLDDAIQSVLQQDYPHWELIIIDNASTDASVARIERYTDVRISLLSEPALGVSRARNRGLDLARGAFICFLDADDRLPQASLRVRLEYAEMHAHLALIDGSVVTYAADFTNPIAHWTPTFTGNYTNELACQTGSCFRGVTAMVRSTAIGDVRFPINQSHAEDLSFYLQLALRGAKYGFVEDEVYHIRQRPDSAMSNLEGLAAGYRALLPLIETLHPAVQAEYKKRVRKIVFRSALKAGHIALALRSLSW